MVEIKLKASFEPPSAAYEMKLQLMMDMFDGEMEIGKPIVTIPSFFVLWRSRYWHYLPLLWLHMGFSTPTTCHPEAKDVHNKQYLFLFTNLS